MLVLKRNKGTVLVEQTWEQRILLGMATRPESARSASRTLALGKVEPGRVGAVTPAPACCEGAGIPERNAGSLPLQGGFFSSSFLF